MDWKARKDKLKADAPAIETLEAESSANPSATEDEETSAFDLSGSAFRTDTPDRTSQPTQEPHFQEETQPVFQIETPHFFAEQPQAAPIATAPPAEPFAQQRNLDISPEREAIAPGLVTTDTETGLPKVAPFVLDTLGTAQSAAEPDRMHSLIVRIGKLSATFFLVKDVTTIGRPDSATQNYPDIEVDLDDSVSRRHAEIRQDEGIFSISDVGSTNGTLLNGERLPPYQQAPLEPGDRIRIGERTELQFE